MRYTESEDGIDRVTLHLPVRLDKKQISAAKRMAAENRTDGDWHQMLASIAWLTVEHEIDEFMAHEPEIT